MSDGATRPIDDAIGFGINLADIAFHYTGVWKALGASRVRAVPLGDEAANREIAALVSGLGYDCIDLHRLAATRSAFRVFVTHHYCRKLQGRPIFKALGRFNVRFNYTLSQSGWNFQDWNNDYDAFLCYGPYHRESFAARYPGRPCVEMGYPRYDFVHDGSVDRRAIRRDLGVGDGRRVAVWLPTYAEFCSIDLHAEAVNAAAAAIDVVVKPHPISRVKEPGRVALLRRQPNLRVVDGDYDAGLLMAAADDVIADYGGPLFGAIYNDRNLVLLDVPGNEGHRFTGPDSPEMSVRRAIAPVAPGAGRRLADLLTLDAAQTQAPTRAALRARYFAPHFGTGSAVAAAALLDWHANGIRREAA